MPRFFFNSEDGEAFRDKTGMEFPDFASARREGVRMFGELILSDPDLLLKTQSFKVFIQDESRLTLYVLDMSGFGSPAVPN
jgi:hypothetical protein